MVALIFNIVIQKHVVLVTDAELVGRLPVKGDDVDVDMAVDTIFLVWDVYEGGLVVIVYGAATYVSFEHLLLQLPLVQHLTLPAPNLQQVIRVSIKPMLASIRRDKLYKHWTNFHILFCLIWPR